MHKSHDISVEFYEVSGWNPILSVTRIADRVYFIVVQKGGKHIKLEHVTYEARVGIFSIPVVSNLGCVFLISDWIEKWLTWQPWWEFAKP